MKAHPPTLAEGAQRRDAFRVRAPAHGGPHLRLHGGPLSAEPERELASARQAEAAPGGETERTADCHAERNAESNAESNAERHAERNVEESAERKLQREPLRLQLLDLSLTGCAAVRPAQHAGRLVAAPWCAATLELEPHLHLPLRLLPHEVTPQAGAATPWRCSWVLLRPQDEPVLQRWLTQAQQQQRQLEQFTAHPAGAAAAGLNFPR